MAFCFLEGKKIAQIQNLRTKRVRAKIRGRFNDHLFQRLLKE